ncbi:serine hydrolase domain-containing protein [Sphingosinicella rhizophila]|uniref:Serine hydrolase domain-containing protein n=1 Tax=Sphingosinicella rhizophila TaxID=3050082 RepID=A0ABU3Q9K2_9SPHN|nr:serine hydrolase domain-containing protein [Sphingosinicella sp. GR2756]MDT9600089.1 serine hydrolase domain-containing protein [Sphingosinicella sp. GR2756]
MKLALALALLALPLPLMAQAPAPADTPGQTAAGIAFTQPKDWSVIVKGPATIFSAPEGDLDIAVVNIGEAADGPAAVARAWSLYKPQAARTPRLTVPGTPGDGWDERLSVAYETSPNEKKMASASAMRVGKAWTVVIAEGGEATANKRSAAAGLIQGSLRPAGYKPESFAGRKAHRLTPDKIQELRDFVAQSAQTLGVPGVGIALIDQGKVVWQGGVGVRELGGTERVDENTKFMIASNTKGMATLLLSVMADEGKLRWDQKVTDLYPSFRLGSDEATESTLVRHLVCACTGLPRKDYAFILDSEGVPASDTFRQLSLTKPTSKFGELFQYSNLMASAAGYLGGHLAYPDMEIGAAFDKAMQTRIFDPLGMKDTGFDNAAAETGNWARPHGLDVNGNLVEIPNTFNHLIVPHRPAGGAWSTAADMARYAQLEITKGIAPNGKRIVSEANILKRREHGVPLGEDAWYGMGLMDRIESGVQVVTHGGTLQGYHSSFWVLPQEGIGAVMLTNSDPGASMLGPFLRRLLEVVYDGKPEAAQAVAAAAKRLKASAEVRRARLTVPGDPAIFANLATRYRDSEGRIITISDKDGGKWMKAGFIEGPLATRKNPDGTVSIVSVGGGNIGVDAVVGTSDAGRTLTIRDSQHEYAYTEVK